MRKIIVFVKAPVPGRVKTRLCPPLSPEQAAGLYAAFAKDTIEAARKIQGARLEIAYDAGEPFPDPGWLGGAVPHFFQRGPNLGSRLVHAFNRAFLAGADKAVVIGSDMPTIEPRTILKAFDLLGRKDAVLGPASDGGYYLVGLGRPAPALFDGIAWSTPRVLGQTLKRMESLGLSCGLLPERGDIDTFADLEALERRLGMGSRARLRFTVEALRCHIPAFRPAHSREAPARQARRMSNLCASRGFAGAEEPSFYGGP